MVIPKGVNFVEFYKQATSKGIKVNSRYKGVVVHKNNAGGLFWKAVYQSKKINKSLLHKVFPFTEQGELDAYKKSQAFIKTNNLPTRKSRIKSRNIQ